jgi:hypothetical protein
MHGSLSAVEGADGVLVALYMEASEHCDLDKTESVLR